MNRFRTTFTALLCLLGCFTLMFHMGCQSPTEPSGNLNVGFEWANVDLLVEFTDTTEPPGRSWSWSFGDARGKSIEQDPLYEYLAAGEYLVKFKSCGKSNLSGNCATVTRLVTVP